MDIKNGVRQGGLSSVILSDFVLNEVISDTSKLLAWYTLNCSKVNILERVNDLVLVGPTAQALQFLLNDLPPNYIHCHPN